ncbi:MAG: 3-dehydroquinate synthase [Verrucomicrobia bacterium]|nr:3-dehydroquinate synthase [Verrucomicrobiota bacterium]
MKMVPVLLGNRSYEIHIGPGLLGRLGAECAALKLGSRCAIITDKQVAKHYGPAAEHSLRAAGFDPKTIALPVGEQAKNLDEFKKCHLKLDKHRLERNSFIVALGGGVVGDVAGFVAATHLRGIHFVQVPTTLLAQVDSSVGGKVGLNTTGGKNRVGVFYQPRLVLCDLDTLRTLSGREFQAGLAEIIKYGIIYDATLFARLERDIQKLLRREPKVLAAIVARCCKIKADVVSHDETETGLRAILNFGHTIGHALEAISGYHKRIYLHGEAISVGQVYAAQLSERICGLPPRDVERITRLFERAKLPIRPLVKLDAARLKKLFAAMRLDKKVSGGEIKFVLAEKIGRVRFGCGVPSELVRGVLDYSAH